MTSFSDVGEWEEVLGPRISGQVPTPARHLPGPPLRFPTPFYLGWGGVCRWGGVVTRDGLGVLDPDALCPLTPSRRDGLLAVRLESHRGLESRPSPLGGRFPVREVGCR